MLFWNGFGNIPTFFDINKGVVSTVRSDSQNLISYPDEMEGHITFEQEGNRLNVTLDQDFPNSDPITINLSLLEDCSFNLHTGIINVGAVCPNTVVNVGSGILRSSVTSDTIGTLRASVRVGNFNVDTSHNNLHEDQIGAKSAMLSGENELFHNEFSLGVGNMDIY